jgi:hypothetical protein
VCSLAALDDHQVLAVGTEVPVAREVKKGRTLLVRT